MSRSKPLSDRQVRALVDEGEHAVGGVAGLVLRVRGGRRTLRLRYRNADRVMRNKSFGAYPSEVSLAEARKLAGAILREVRKGQDPIGEETAARSIRLEAAIEGYFDGAAAELRPKTIETYRLAADKFLAWAKKKRIGAAMDLTRGHLAAFRTYLIKLPGRTPAANGKRGAKRSTGEKRSALSVNRELRTMKTILDHLRRAGKLPGLDRDAIRDNLGALKTSRVPPRYLTPGEIGKLLASCERHDAEVFAATREEHAGRGEKGSTPRYRPIFTFALFLLLSGCRRGEALALRWCDVELDAVDHNGAVVGEIRIRADVSKTHHARTVYLDVSPALRRMLAAMKLRATADEVFHGYSVHLVNAARNRLQRTYGAPAFDWQALRSTCATYLTNAPGIFGSRNVYLSANQLGHSVAVAEKHYLNAMRGIPAEAKTLEDAMRIDADSLAGVLRKPERSLGAA